MPKDFFYRLLLANQKLGKAATAADDSERMKKVLENRYVEIATQRENCKNSVGYCKRDRINLYKPLLHSFHLSSYFKGGGDLHICVDLDYCIYLKTDSKGYS